VSLWSRIFTRETGQSIPPIPMPEPERSVPAPPPACLPTGIGELDEAIGGGIPRGTFTEIFGPASCGKTTLALRIAAAAQGRGATVFYADSEFTLDAALARVHGIDVDTMLFARPAGGGQFREIAARLIESRCVDLLVLDTLAALPPPDDTPVRPGSEDFRHAEFVSLLLGDLGWRLKRARAAMILVNHQRRRVMEESGEVATTSVGGMAVRLRSGVRLELSPRGGRVWANVLKRPAGGMPEAFALPFGSR
jgi:recombination protein RecA